jgi:hypothetical protein
MDSTILWLFVILGICAIILFFWLFYYQSAITIERKDRRNK